MKEENFINMENISMLNEVLNQEKPKHPLISIIDFDKVDFLNQPDIVDKKITTTFYCILLKKMNSGSVRYGRNYYDFQEGSLFFVAPNQVSILENPVLAECEDDWGLFFHPDLIRGTSLSKKIKEYSFFNYHTNEALHLSDEEKQMISNMARSIDIELSRPIDKHSKTVIVSSIELLLNHCMRYYDRQFITRTETNKDVISIIDDYLMTYFKSDKPQELGLPTVQQCASEVNLSANYLADLLKAETGKSTQDHIHYYVFESAKNRLLNSNDSVSEIAYSLGYEYPQYFSKIFKKKVGMTPVAYRNLN